MKQIARIDVWDIQDDTDHPAVIDGNRYSVQVWDGERLVSSSYYVAFDHMFEGIRHVLGGLR